jgi:hypothetical protein
VPAWPSDFTYIGKTVLQSAPYPNDANGSPVGDFRWGKGLAIHAEADGSVTIFTGSWNPQPVLRWRVAPAADGTFSGNATFMQSLGTGVYVRGELIGLYLDDDGDLISSFNSTYDTDPAIDWTMGRAYIDPGTGLAVSRGTFKFANRSDKMTQGGVTGVPDWWRAAYNPNCNALVGWGGYWSVIATGPASMGPAAACVALPTDADMPVAGGTSTPLPNVPVLGFPFSSSVTVQTAATQRVDTDYYQTYGWGWWPASVSTGLGWWNPGDSLYQGCTWADTPAVSGLVCIPLLQEGCNWYGSNATPPTLPVCSTVPGKAASLNSQRQRPWVFIYDPKDLGDVAIGARSQSSVQPVSQTSLALPGLTTPFPGLPDISHVITGVTFEPTKKWLAIMVRDTSTATGRPTIFWYKVRS